jgi:alpha-tubulin suppressor-like RCC1 family protein
MNSGNVYTWGIKAQIERPVAITTLGTKLFVPLDDDGSILGQGSSVLTAATPQQITIPSGATIMDACAGDFHVTLLSYAGNVYSFGSDKYGQLGDGNSNT